MALAGPHLVRAAVGEDVSQEELGGSRVHCRRSGVGDLEVADDPECIARIREYLGFFPSHCEQAPPMRESSDPHDRMDEGLLGVLPESNRKPHDMYEVIRRIVDDGHWLDLKPQWARTIITCLARMGGRPVGIVANQPKHLGASWTTTRPTRPRGSSTCAPKVSVVVRKAYGAGYYVMNGRAYEPDLIVAWPSAEISVMGAEGAVEIIFRRQVEAAADPVAEKGRLTSEFQGMIDVYRAASNAMIDDVIDPRETRPTVIRALELAQGKRVERPWKRHGVVPV
jgi:acetyl-CoA carboxylase carboxyltransferase component